MTHSGLSSSRAAWLLLGLGMMAGGGLFAGCQSRPRDAVYMVRPKKPAPTADKTPTQAEKLAALIREPHIRDVRYQRFVRPWLSRRGCDSVACHGDFRGGGLYLSEASATNREDYQALLLRLDRKNPEKSELLQKITEEMPHNGGRNLNRTSCDYARLVAWIGEQPEPTCSDPPATEAGVRFAREVAPALVALGCAEKSCHGGGPAQARFDLAGLLITPPATERARLEVSRLSPDKKFKWMMPIMRAVSAEDGKHQKKADPLSCASRRLYGWFAQSPELTCELAPKTPVQLPSLEVFATQVQPVLDRRRCGQMACHGSGSGGMWLLGGGPGDPRTLHDYLMFLARIEDLAHIDDSTLLRTARNKEPHGGGARLGGKGDCVDDHMTAWLRSQPIKTCPPPQAPPFERFVSDIQPVLDKMTCTNQQCHGGLIPHFILAKNATALDDLKMNYRAVVNQIDYDYTPLSGVMMRMRQSCAYAITLAWIDKKPKPKCVVADPDPRQFPRIAQGMLVHPKAVPGPPTPAHP